jgi:hypothetical protein
MKMRNAAWALFFWMGLIIFLAIIASVLNR